MQWWLLLTILIIFPCTLSAQDGFCLDKNFRVLETGVSTILQEIHYDESSGKHWFTDIQHYPDRRLNAITYFNTDQRIYGLDLSNGIELISIDADLVLHSHGALSVINDLLYVAATMDQDDGIMYVLGYHNDVDHAVLLTINLRTKKIEKELPVFSDYALACADLVFDHGNGQLIGFDHKSQILTSIIPKANHAVTEPLFSATVEIFGGVPSLFFTHRGKLLGIGSPALGADYHLYEFDLRARKILILQDLSYENNQDACTCAQPILFTNEFNPHSLHCDEGVFVLKIKNIKNHGEYITVSDSLPSTTHIISLTANQPIHMVNGGVGYNYFSIELMGDDINDLEIEIAIKGNEGIGDVSDLSQSILYLSPDTLFSDDPNTPYPGDATTFTLNSEEEKIDTFYHVICKNEYLTLHTNITQQAEVAWSNGSTDRTIQVYNEGMYTVQTESLCQSIREVHIVHERDFQIDLGPDIQIEDYKDIELSSAIEKSDSIAFYTWNGTPNYDLCNNCSSQILNIQESGFVQLTAMNKFGCMSIDEIQFTVRPAEFFIPNAFTPNGDLANELLRVYSSASFTMERIQIFNRWGSIINMSTGVQDENDILWDGSAQGRPAQPGVYLYQASIIKNSGERKLLTGEVTLLR